MLKDYPNVCLYKTNGKDLSLFPEGKFDFVFSLFVFQHLEKEDTYLYLTEIFRVLKGGGSSYLQFPNFLADWHFENFQKVAKEFGSNGAAKMRYYTLPEVRKMLECAGFNIEKLTENESIIAIVSKKA